MNLEIERKFLLKNDSWRTEICRSISMRQGYISNGTNATFRIRIAGEKAFLTVKGHSVNYSRSEFEYEIPFLDAKQMLDELSVGLIIEKIRHEVIFAGKLWEIDEFQGENSGLITAEIELDFEGESFQIPPFIGDEVSDDWKYKNSALAQKPFKMWDY